MKTTNYLQLEYRRTLRLFRKLQSRFEKRISNKTIGELTARKRYKLLKKLEKLKARLSELLSRLKLAGLAGAMGLAGLTFDAEAQFLPDKARELDRYELNSTIAGDQTDTELAINDEGSVAAIWMDGYDIKANYAYPGEAGALGETTIFSGSAGVSEASHHDVAINAEGDFVVVWQQDDAGDKSIQMLKFDISEGTTDGPSLVDDISDETSDSDQKITAAIDNDGDVFVTYVEDTYTTYAASLLTYVENGGAASAPIVLNESSITTYNSYNPSIALNNDGESIVTWSEYYYDGFYGGQNIKYQKFDADLTNPGSVNDLLSVGFGMYSPYLNDHEIDLNNNGDFALVTETEYFGSPEVYAYRYDKDGNSLGSATVFNTNFPSEVSIAMDNNGSFVVAGIQDYGIYDDVVVRRYNTLAQYVDQFNGFASNSTTAFDVSSPEVAISSNGDFSVVWSDDLVSANDPSIEGNDNSGDGAYLARFKGISPPIEIDEGTFGQDDFSYREEPSKIVSNDDGDYIIVWREVYSGSGTYYYIKAQRYLANNEKDGAELLLVDNGTSEDIFHMDADMNNDGEFVIAWNTPLGIFKQYFDVDDVGSAIHTLSTDGSNHPISVSIDETGDYSVVAWRYYFSGEKIIYVNTGTDDTSNIPVNDFANDTGYAAYPQVAITENQDFVVVWQDESDLDNLGMQFDYSSIHQRRFSGSTPVSDVEVIALRSEGIYGLENPEVVADSDTGDYAVVYSNKYGTMAATYHADGSNILPTFRVNDVEDYNLSNYPEVDLNAEGEFVVSWEGEDNQGNTGIIFKKYDGAGNVIINEYTVWTSSVADLQSVALGQGQTILASEISGPGYRALIADPNDFEFVNGYEEIVNQQTSDHQDEPQIATNINGDYVVVWEDENTVAQSIAARVYDVNDNAQTDEIVINDAPDSSPVNDPKIALNDDGIFMIVWHDSNSSSIQGQITNIDETVILTDFDVATNVNSPFDVALDENGDFVVVWADYYSGSGLGYSDVYARKYSASDGAPITAETFLFTTEEGFTYNRIDQLKIATNTGGDLGIAFGRDIGNYNSDMNYYLRTYASDLTTSHQADPFLLATDNNCVCYYAQEDDLIQIIADGNGDFIVGVYDEEKYEVNSVNLHRYTPGAGSISVGPVEVAADPGLFSFDLSTAENGDFIIVYGDGADSNNNYSGINNVMSQRVDENFNAIGKTYRVSNIISESAIRPKVVSTSAGRYVSAWGMANLDGSSYAVAKATFHSFVPFWDYISFPPSIDEGGSTPLSLDPAMIINGSDLGPVTFSLTEFPQNGSLYLDGVLYNTNVGIPIEDIDLISYTHDGGETTDDTFSAVVSNGSFDAEEISIDFTINPVNDPTQLTANNGMTVDEEGTSSFYGTLAATDPDNTSVEMIYTITALPSHGTIWNVQSGEIELGVNDTFSQRDVAFAYVEYRHNGDEESTDSFEFTFGDLEFTSTTQTFSIDVNPVNDAPALSLNTNVALDEAGTVTITNASLLADDPDHLPSDVTYEVFELPEYGELQLDGVTLALNDTFTQDDVDNSLLTYVNDGTNPLLHSSFDDFGFNLSDGDGESGPSDYLGFDITDINDTPTVENAIEDQSATEDIVFDFTLASDVFGDEESISFNLSAAQGDDSPLPTWLTFDGFSFSGTPLEGDGDIDVVVTAEDEGGLTVSDEFTISVTGVNDAPILVTEMADQAATEDIAFNFSVPAGTFSDEETLTLTLTALQSDDSPLPGWLTFDGASFSGTPLHGDTDVDIVVTAEDEGGLTILDQFLITVEQVNDMPTVVNTIPNEEVVGYDPFSFEIDPAVFDDEEDDLILSVSGLPSFVSYNTETATFSGEAAINFDEGIYTITVTATEDNDDQQSVSATFDLEIVAVLSTLELENEIAVYPNPAHSTLSAKINNEEMGLYQIRLIDQSGRLVKTDEFDKSKRSYVYQLNIHDLTKGLYILNLTGKNTSYTFRITKD